MNFTNAYVVGVDRNNQYLGERTAQYRSVDTISVEGYIDVRGSNDFSGVRQTLSAIESNFISPTDNKNVLQEININGTGFGTGRIVSLDFPASQSVDENQIRIGKYTANIEVYNTGNFRDSLEGYDVPSPQFLDSFSQNLSISLDEQNIYNLTHSLDITYLSGVITGSGGSASAFDPISGAKSLATGLFAQIPSQYSTIIPDSYGGIASAARSYYTENYSLIDGSCSFEKTFQLLPSGLSTYSLTVSNKFSLDQAGIIKVSEDGTIEPRSTDFFDEAKAALEDEIGKSFSRCSTVYNSYKNYLGTNVGTLFNQPVTQQRSVNNSSAVSNYSVEYTDDLQFQNLTSLQTRELQLSVSNDNVVSVTENGTVTSINSKSNDFNPYPLIPSRTTIKQRCSNFYDDYMPDGNNYTLKNISNKITVPRFGKQVSYNFTFSDDASVFDRDEDAVFARKTITHSDKIGVPVQGVMIIPNVANQVLHTPGQTSLGTRSTKFESQLRRTAYINNIDNLPIPTSAINTAKTESLQDCYSYYVDNNLIRTLPGGTANNGVYVTNASYSYDSNNTFSMSLDATFSMLRVNGNAELNLSLSGEVA